MGDPFCETSGDWDFMRAVILEMYCESYIPNVSWSLPPMGFQHDDANKNSQFHRGRVCTIQRPVGREGLDWLGD